MKTNILSAICIAFGMSAFAQGNLHSLSFDYVGAFVEVPNQDAINPTAAITICAWIKPDSWATNIWENYVVGKDDWSVSTAGYALRGGSDGKLSFNIGTQDIWKEVVSDPLLPTGVWSHIAGTFDGTVMKIYIDGFLVGSLDYSGTITPSLYNLNIGNVPFLGQGNRLFDGQIDQVEIWNIALTEEQINEYIECTPTGTETGLVGLWTFEEGDGIIVADLTSNHNNGLLVNDPDWSDDVPLTCEQPNHLTAPEQAAIAVFPNPSSDGFTVRAPGEGAYFIADEWGRTLHRFILNGDNQYQQDVNGLPSGLYSIVGEQPGGTTMIRILVIR